MVAGLLAFYGGSAPSPEPRVARRVPPDSAFFSRAACQARLRAQPRRAERGPRIGTWNIRWFPHGAHAPGKGTPTDLDWLACAIASLDVDVLAVQEIVQDPAGRAALIDLRAKLDSLTGGTFREFLDDCTASRFQHVGFLYDARRVELRSPHVVAALNPGRSACDRSLRPGVAAYARFASGLDLHLLSVHLDSGTLSRDYGNRRESVAAMQRVAPALRRKHADADLLLLGDLNTMGCKQCQPSLTAQDELARLDAELAGLSLVRLSPRDDRACTHYHRGRPGLLDHVVAASGMRALAAGARVEVHGPCRDLACGRAARGEQVAAWKHLSDHCPLIVELAAGDLD